MLSGGYFFLHLMSNVYVKAAPVCSKDVYF